MSTTIKFGSSPEEIHWVGELGADIWDMIYTYKEMAEEQDKINHGMIKVLDNNTIHNASFKYWEEYNSDRANYFEDRLYEKHANSDGRLEVFYFTHPSVRQDNPRACLVCRTTVLCTPTQEFLGDQGWMSRGWICSKACERECTGEESDDEE